MDLMTLVAKLTLDSSEYERGLSGVADKAKKGLGAIAKAGVAVVAAGGAAVVALTKQSIDAYAEFEQLAGGAQLMFGDAYDTVAKNAQEAYTTVQMSQNDYLQQVNGFATGLKTALGGNEQAAAELAHRIIVAEADVVAATGNSQEAVQNAFNGIMKSNFTMLDNLQIGITPTKEGFQEVIDKVNEWNAANGRATKYEMGNLADMQSALVDYIEMVGMAGYAHNEAADTIQGSISTMKASWQNLVVGLADQNADLDKLIENFVESIIGKNGEGGVLNNILPVAKRVLNGVVKLITTTAPKIVPIITEVIIENLPAIIEAGTQILVALINGILVALPQLIAALPEIFAAIANAFQENWPALKESGKQLLEMIGEGILSALDWLLGKLSEIADAIKKYLLEKWEDIKKINEDTWNNIKERSAQIWDEIKNKVSDVWENIKTAAKEKWENIKTTISNIGTNIKTDISQVWENIKSTVQQKIDSLKTGISTRFENIKNTISGVIDRIKGLFDFEWSFPHISLPHFSWSWQDIGGIVKIPQISVEWYKKAYTQPYMFTKPTLAGFGDGNGGEMVYGRDNLMKDIREAVGGTSNITINVYPQKGQNEEEIARMVQRKLIQMDRQKKVAGFA